MVEWLVLKKERLWIEKQWNVVWKICSYWCTILPWSAHPKTLAGSIKNLHHSKWISSVIHIVLSSCLSIFFWSAETQDCVGTVPFLSPDLALCKFEHLADIKKDLTVLLQTISFGTFVPPSLLHRCININLSHETFFQFV